MSRKVLVVTATAAQFVLYAALIAWTVAGWQRSGWTGLAFNSTLSETAERASKAGPFPVGSRQVVAIAPRSPVASTDIRESDRVVAVNAIELDDLDGLRELDRAVRTRDTVTYTLERDGVEHEVTVQLESPLTSPFVVANMASTLAVGLIWLLISLLVFWSRPQARTANLFFLLASAGAALHFVWAAGDLRWPDLRGILPTTSSVGSWIFIGAITGLSILFANLLLHLALVFPKPRPVVESWPRVFVWIHTIPFLLFIGLGSMVGSARLSRSVPGLLALELSLAVLASILAVRLIRAAGREGWQRALLARPLAIEILLIAAVCHLGPIIRLLPDGASLLVGIVIGLTTMIYLVGWLTAYSVLTCVSLYRSYRESGVDVQRQVRWPLWGTLTAVAVSIFITLFSIAIGFLSSKLGISAYTFTTITNSLTKAAYLLIPLSFAFAILKYRLLDIDVIIRKTVIYSGVTGVVLALYLLLAGISGAVLVRAAGVTGETATIVTTLAVAALFVPIRNRVQAFVDRRFFQRERSLVTARQEISQLVLGETDLTELLPAIADTIQRSLQCRNVAVFALAPDGGDLRIAASVGLPDERVSALRLSRSSAVVGSPARIVRSGDDEALRRAKSEMAAVARRGDDLLGVLSVGSRLGGEPFDHEDEAFLAAAADQLSLAIGRARQHRAEAELSQAREIQRSLLPAAVPEIDGIEVATRWQPAREVSGDYFDVLRIDDRRLAMCIGDVVGKGMPAALLMSSLQASLKAVAHQVRSPKEVCSRVREVMLGSLRGGTFVTFFYCLLDREAGRLSYCTAGHNPPLLVRADGTLVRLDVGGPIFARIAAGQPYHEATVQVASGDRLVLFTDGASEAMDPAGEMFEEARLEELVVRNRGATAAELEKSITEAVLEHARGSLQDDLTLVVAAIL